MKLRSWILASASAAGLMVQSAPGIAQPETKTTREVVEMIGINTRIPYTDGAYRLSRDVIADLDFLGVRKVRDHNLNPAWDRSGQANYARLAASGVKFNLVVTGGASPAEAVARAEDLEKLIPGSVIALEGPNEIDHGPFSYRGLAGDIAAGAFQRDLFDAVKASRRLKDRRVYSYSLFHGAKPQGGYDAVALHPYPQNGDQPRGWFEGERKLAPAGAAAVITETGYSSLASWWMGVDDKTQAKLTLNAILDAADLGFQDLYLYELLEAYPDPKMSDGGRHYGLFDLGNRPKPAATAIRNLIKILSDAPAAKPTQAQDGVRLTLTGDVDGVRSLRLRRRTGESVLAVWNEPDLWDQNRHAPIAPKPARVSVTVSGACRDLKVYDPLAAAAPVAQSNDKTQASLELVGAVMLLEIGGLSGRC